MPPEVRLRLLATALCAALATFASAQVPADSNSVEPPATRPAVTPPAVTPPAAPQATTRPAVTPPATTRPAVTPPAGHATPPAHAQPATRPAAQPTKAGAPIQKFPTTAPAAAAPKAELPAEAAKGPAEAEGEGSLDYMSMVFVFMLATFIGIGVIRRVSRLLHTPLMSLTNAISAIAVVGSIVVTGSPHYPTWIRVLGAVALFASMTNIVSGFLITDRMLKMFKTREGGKS
jgi:H+-translocating NAD(P) transhydrogenase subunit alpha